MARLASICPDCGTPFERDDSYRGAACPDCTPPDDGSKRARRAVGTTAQRGYGYRWQQLSKRARELSPLCEDCGSPDDLTTDHTTEAWERLQAGKSIGLQHVAVVCRRCNSERGAARGELASDQWRSRGGVGYTDPRP